MENSNGNSAGMVPQRVSTLTLSFDPFTSLLNVTGETASLDEALNMLAQATRTFEDRRRMATLAAMQQQQAQAAVEQRIRADLQRRN